MGTFVKLAIYTQICLILANVKLSEEASKSYISKHDLVLEYLLPLNFTRGNALTHKREERDIDGSGDGESEIIRRSSEEEAGHKDAEVFDEKLMQRTRSKENLESYEGSGANAEDESIKNQEAMLTHEGIEDPFTKELEPEIVKTLLGVENPTKSPEGKLGDDNDQDNTLSVLTNVEAVGSLESEDEGSGDDEGSPIVISGEEKQNETDGKSEEAPENEIVDEVFEKSEEERLNSFILQKASTEATTTQESVEATTIEDVEPTAEEELQTTEAEEITTEEAETAIEEAGATTEEAEGTTEEPETTTEDIITSTIEVEFPSISLIPESSPEPSTTTEEIPETTTETAELEIATTETFLESSTTPGTTTESANETETPPENILDFVENTTLGRDPLLMVMDTKLSESNEEILLASREPKRLGAYIVIGLILLSFLSLIGYIALKKRITKRRKELESNQETKDTEKALLSLSEYKDHPDAEENNIKNNEITPIVIQNSQRNKFEKNTNFSSPKNLNTNANEKTIEKDNVLKSTSDNLTHVIIEDAAKDVEEEKENIPNTEKLIVRTHLDPDSIPKKTIIINRTSGGYLPVSQDNVNM